MMLNSDLTKFSVKWHKVLTTVMTVVEFLSVTGKIHLYIQTNILGAKSAEF